MFDNSTVFLSEFSWLAKEGFLDISESEWLRLNVSKETRSQPSKLIKLSWKHATVKYQEDFVGRKVRGLGDEKSFEAPTGGWTTDNRYYGKMGLIADFTVRTNVGT